MAVTKIKPIKSTLSKALDYIQNPDKTDGKTLVSSFGCSYETADIEFGFTLAQAIEKGNNLAHHLIQSFEPGEVDYEKAHEIGKQLADAVTKGQHVIYVNPSNNIVIAITSYFKPTIFDRIDFVQKYVEPVISI